MDYKNMSELEIANVMVNYINRADHLKRIISNYIDGADGRSIPVERIKAEYTQLKRKIREDADYLNLVKNHNDRSIDICGCYFSKYWRSCSI